MSNLAIKQFTVPLAPLEPLSSNNIVQRSVLPELLELNQNEIIKTMSRDKDIEFESNSNMTYDNVDKLLEKIIQDKEKISNKLFIISAAYDKIYKKYNRMSLFILILSSITTLIEAFRLTIMDFILNSKYIISNVYMISFTISILSLLIGTIITVLSSIIRFRNYREIMEKLKDTENFLIVYKSKYSKKYDLVINKLATNNLKDFELKIIYDK